MTGSGTGATFSVEPTKGIINAQFIRAVATEEECIEAAKQANANEFITNLPQGYDTMITERRANLSQGQRQMITTARAMVAQPKMLILDKVFGPDMTSRGRERSWCYATR